MKKFFSIVAIATLAIAGMTSCSNENDEIAQASNVQTRGIAFKASTDFSQATRGYAINAANVATTLPNFQTWAYDDTTDGLYMGTSATVGRTVTNTSMDGSAWDYEPVQFWPVNPLNFVAIAPAAPNGVTGNSTASASNVVTLTTNVTLSTNVEDQDDIMYANADDYEKTDDDGNVPYTFKHALSQIVFKGKFNDEGAITKATVAEISLCNVKKTGVLTYTSDGYFYGSTNSSTVLQVPAASLSEPAIFTLDGSDLETLETNAGEYTFAEQGSTAFNMTISNNSTLKNAWMLLPQTVAAWDGTSVGDGSAGHALGVPDDGGAYIKLRVKLEKDGVVIKDNAAADAIYLPLAISWDRSKKYIYTIEFNGANALTPITFSVAAEDWTDADPQPAQIDF